MSDSALIVAKLRGVRLRQFLSLLAGSVCISLCGIAVLALLFTFTPLRFPLRPRVAAITLCGAALAASLVLSFLRMPSWKATAKLVDRSMGLQQRVETAWECLDRCEEIDLLLLKDASRRLLPVSPAEVVPMRFDRTAGIGLLIGVVALTGLGILRILGGWHGSGFRAGNTPVATSAPSQADSARTAAASKRQVQSAAQASTLPNTNPESGRLSPANEPARGDKNPDAASLQPSGQPPVTSKPDKGAGSDQIKPSATAATTKPGASPDSGEQLREQPAKTVESKPSQESSLPSSRSSGNSGSSSRSDAGTASIRAAERKGSQGSSAPAARGAESSSGGMLSGRGIAQPLGLRALGKNDAAFLARYSRDYQAFRLAAEPAMAKEKIPPGFRKYIADYFKAIHP